MTSEHIAYGSAASLRDFIAENISLAGIHRELVCTYAGIGDDRGLEYALRRFAAHVSAALSAFSGLKKTSAQQRGATNG